MNDRQLHEAKPTDNLAPTRSSGDTTMLLLASGGLAAAFGAASCCALPMLLASFGLSSASLIAIAWLAAPHRVALMAVSVACLAGGGLLLWRRRAIACAADGSGAHPAVPTALSVGMLSITAVLVVLGFVFA